jgi:Predicted membrane protein (DUF2339)
MGVLLAIIALVWIYTLSNRIDALEKRGSSGTVEDASPRALTPVEQAAFHASTRTERVELSPERIEERRQQMGIKSSTNEPVAEEPDPISRFIAWVRIDFMMKLGAFLILCAFGWFVSYAFMNDLIGEAGRIALGLIAGSVFLVLGYVRSRTYLHQGSILAVLGSGTILLTVYAAREFYGFFTPFSSLLIMFLAVAFVAFMSVRYERRSLALASLILATMAPFFTNNPYPDVVERFTYLLVIVFGSLWVVYLRGWSTVTLGALVMVFLHGLPYLNLYGMGGDADIVLLFTFVFGAVFFVANLLGLIANENDENRIPHLLIAVGTGLYLMLWIATAADPEWRSLLYVAWMLVFSVGSFIVYRFIERPEAFYIYGGTSIALLAAATAEELTGPALTIAFTFEVAALVLIASSVLKNFRVAGNLAWLFLVPIMLSLGSIFSSAWRGGIFHSDFFVLVTLMFALAVSGQALLEGRKKEPSDHADMGTSLIVISGVFGIVFIWLVLHAGSILSYETATLFTLVIYTVFGLVCFNEARATGIQAWKYAGGALIALVLARLLFVEVWNMDLAGRIITFFVIGILFLSTALMGKKGKILSDVTPSQH